MLRWLSFALGLCAAVPAQACDTGPFRLHYDSGSVQISEADRGVLDYMREVAQEDGYIRLSGHTDTAGPAEENLRLARRRVESARAILLGLGLPPSRILTESFGESRSITALDDSTPSSRHRYVLVELLSPAEARKGRIGRAKTGCGG